MKIITLTGGKNTKKEVLAYRLAKNSDVSYIKPYTDREVSDDVDESELNGYNYVSKDTLDTMIEEDEVLCSRIINGNRYVFFKSQLIHDYNVMIVDDYALVDLQSNWKEDLYSIKVKSNNEKASNRIDTYLYDHEFDKVYNIDTDDFDALEWGIGYGM